MKITDVQVTWGKKSRSFILTSETIIIRWTEDPE